MRFLSIYYEPRYNDLYLSENIRLLARTFNVKKVRINKVNSAEELNLKQFSTWPRILLVGKYINPEYESRLCLDGISLHKNNISIVRYQTSLRETVYVLGHELAHLLNVEHCHSRKCIMGTYIETGKVHYAWWKIAHNKQLSKNLFCEQCKSNLMNSQY